MLEEILFQNGSYEDKIAAINNLNTSALLGVGEGIIKRAMDKCGYDDRFYIPAPDSFWNAYVEAIHLLKGGRIGVEIYVQDDSTDTSMIEYWSEFVRNRNYVSSNNRLNVTARFSPEDIAEVVRRTLKRLVWKMYSAEANEKQILAKVQNYRLINPVCDYFYEKYRLRYQYDMWAFGRGGCDEYKAYKNAEKVLNAYIKENYKELADKGNEELIETYKKVFADAMAEYLKK